MLNLSATSNLLLHQFSLMPKIDAVSRFHCSWWLMRVVVILYPDLASGGIVASLIAWFYDSNPVIGQMLGDLCYSVGIYFVVV